MDIVEFKTGNVTVVERTPSLDSFSGLYATELKAMDKLVLGNGGYTIDSVVSNALRKGNDPIEALDYTRKRKRPLHYVWPLLRNDLDNLQGEEVFVRVQWGMIIRFEGILFRVKRTDGDNILLEAVR